MSITNSAGAVSCTWLHTSREGFLRHGTIGREIWCRVAITVTTLLALKRAVVILEPAISDKILNLYMVYRHSLYCFQSP